MIDLAPAQVLTPGCTVAVALLLRKKSSAVGVEGKLASRAADCKREEVVAC
jgi:hypothetical protein